jgi:hypothetical protein
MIDFHSSNTMTQRLQNSGIAAQDALIQTNSMIGRRNSINK